MKKAVHDFVVGCAMCQQAKPDRSKYPGLLQLLLVPTGAWQTSPWTSRKGYHDLAE